MVQAVGQAGQGRPQVRQAQLRHSALSAAMIGSFGRNHLDKFVFLHEVVAMLACVKPAELTKDGARILAASVVPASWVDFG